jgi:hypothetical protein
MGTGRPINPRSWLWLRNRQTSRLRLAAVVAIAALLPACTSQLAQLPAAIGGEAEGTPQAPANPPAYPPVHAMPPARPVPVMSDEEQKQAEAELIAARDRQTKPGSQKQAQQAQKKQPAAAKPASSKPPPAADPAAE